MDFNDGAPLVSSTSTTFACSYPQPGTYTPTVVVSQNSETAVAGTKVYVVGQLNCNGPNVLQAPADYRLDWNALSSNQCTSQSLFNSLPASELPANLWNIGGSNGLGFSGAQPASGSYVFYNVEPGNYQYNLSCAGNGTSTQIATSSCSVTVTP